MTLALDQILPVDLADQAYQALRRRILRRELATGAQIPVDLVAAQLGVSRTPVIEALRRLAADGLVEIKPRRGCFVLGLSVEDIREIFEIREALELHAVRRAIQSGRHLGLAEQLEEPMRRMEEASDGPRFVDYDRFIEWDRAFHARLVGSGGNARMQALYRNLNVHLHVMRAHYTRELEAADHVNADHERIWQALRRGDLAAAEAAVSEHLRVIVERIASNLAHDGGVI